MRAIAGLGAMLIATLAVAAVSRGSEQQAPYSARRTPEIRAVRANATAVEAVRAVEADTEPPPPNLSRYPHDIGAAALDWFTSLLDGVRPGLLTNVGDAVRYALHALAAIATAWVLFRLVRGLVHGYRAQRSNASTSPAAGIPDLAPPAARAAASRDQLEARLAAGDASGALEMLWWWLAQQLLGRDADPSWTSRELIREAGRSDLRPLVRRLDRMLYGAELPAGGDVRNLLERLEEALG